MDNQVKVLADELHSDILSNLDSLRDLFHQSMTQEDNLAEKQLMYVVMFWLAQIRDRYKSVLVKPGRGKSYQTEVSYGLSNIERLFKEIELWSTRGIVPEYYDAVLSKKK
jgi:hypothetical protein